MIRPPFLKYDDKAVILSPAGNIEETTVHRAAAILCEWGLKVDVSEHALNATGRFSGFVDQRLTDLQNAFDDSTVKLILCSRGGYGTVHLIDKLNYKRIQQHPKWVIGFSDITLLHAALQSHNIISIHGPMAKHFADEGAQDVSVRFTKAIIAGQPLLYKIPVQQYGHLNRFGKATGRLFGGNLSNFCSILGTPYAKIPKNGILFIEDISEAPYKVDRYINHLKLAGVFDKISGLIVGQFNDYEEDSDMYTALYESISASVSEYNFPICFDFPVGHVKYNFPMIMGEIAFLTISEKQIDFKQFV